MIVKYFHYHVGSYVSKNTREGDTIRLLIKLIVMGQWPRHGEEGIGEYPLNPERLAIPSDVRRRSRRTRRVMPNLEG